MKIRPIKAILICLFFTLIILSIVSAIVGIIFGIDLTDKSSLSASGHNLSYLLSDIFISSVIIYYAGYISCKYTPKKEIKYGFIFSAITLAVYMPIAIINDAFTIYPLWYNFLTVIITVVALLLGAKTREKQTTKPLQ